MSVPNKNITDMIRDRVLQQDPSADIFLFGSQARGVVNDDSDWDILILTNQTPFSRIIEKEFRDALFEIELQIGQPVSTFVFSKKEWEGKHRFTPLYKNIQKEGIPLK